MNPLAIICYIDTFQQIGISEFARFFFYLLFAFVIQGSMHAVCCEHHEARDQVTRVMVTRLQLGPRQDLSYGYGLLGVACKSGQTRQLGPTKEGP